MSDAPAAGVARVDKPEGPTSHDIVATARRVLGERRIGHTGTLDPFASGLLLLCIGRATRLADYLRPLPKTYRAVAVLGVETDTDDASGAVLRTSDAWRRLDDAAARDAFQAHVGPRLQRPPAYSAKKVGGERLYRRARRGEVAEVAPVSVVIHRLEVRRVELPAVEFEVECSSGTYIRAIARDVGADLGVGGHLRTLRRTRIGAHDVRDAVGPERLADPAAVRAAWISPLDALAHLPRIDVDDADSRALAHGVPVEMPAMNHAAVGTVAVAHAGELVAIAVVRGGRIHPRKVFVP